MSSSYEVGNISLKLVADAKEAAKQIRGVGNAVEGMQKKFDKFDYSSIEKLAASFSNIKKAITPLANLVKETRDGFRDMATVINAVMKKNGFASMVSSATQSAKKMIEQYSGSSSGAEGSGGATVEAEELETTLEDIEREYRIINEQHRINKEGVEEIVRTYQTVHDEVVKTVKTIQQGEGAEKVFNENIKFLLPTLRKVNEEFKKIAKTISTSLTKRTSDFMKIFKYRTIRGAITEIMKEINSAFQVIAKGDGSFNEAMSDITSSFLVLTGSIAQFVQPLIRLVAPAIRQMAQFAGNLANAWALFDARVRNSATYMRLNVDYMKDFIEEQKKANSLFGYDKFNALSSTQDEMSDLFIETSTADGVTPIAPGAITEDTTTTHTTIENVDYTGWAMFRDFLQNSIIPLFLSIIAIDIGGKIMEAFDVKGWKQLGVFALLTTLVFSISNIIDGFRQASEEGANFANVMQIIGGILGAVASVLGIIAVFVGGIPLIITAVVLGVVGLGAIVLGWLYDTNEGFKNTIDAIGQWFVDLFTVWIPETWDNFCKWLNGGIEEVGNYFLYLCDDIAYYFVVLLNDLYNIFLRPFIDAVLVIYDIICGLGELIVGIFTLDSDTILSGFKKVMNGIIGIFEISINWLVDALNIAVHSAGFIVSIFGVDTKGWEIPRASLPRLADGGWIGSQGSLFVAGEAGAEMVTSSPSGTGVANVEQIQQAFLGALLQANNMGVFQSGEGSVYLDGQKVGKMVADSHGFQQEASRVGLIRRA